MSCCSFSSVCDVYDDGIVPSLNSPFASLTVSNASFVRCYRTRNVECNGTSDRKLTPGRQNTTENGANSFIWCEWNGSRATGERNSYADGSSNGGAIYMYRQSSASVSVSHCTFSSCYAYYAGGGIFCSSFGSIKVENNSFNSCTAQNYGGGGMCAFDIISCVRISGCEFKSCKAKNYGGGLCLDSVLVSGSDCNGTESGKGESACVFDCIFTSCSITSTWGGGMCCFNVPEKFKMRSLQFISCNALSHGGGLGFLLYQPAAPSNNLYCYFFFFHNCSCSDSTPYGHDVCLQDQYSIFLLRNPFYESYTTSSDEMRVCYIDGNWAYHHTDKKEWLKDKTIYVSVNGSDGYELCGSNETFPCLTVSKAFEMCETHISLTITLMEGDHVSEATTIKIGEKKISVIGKGRMESSIETGALSSSSTTLFSLTSGKLEVKYLRIDHNSIRSPSPSVFVVSVGSGALSLEDVMIDSSISGGSVISASVFEVALRQLKMIDVEIKNMKVSQPLFAEPSSAGSIAGDSVLANVTVRNVNRTTGDGVVIAKSVKAREAFIVWNTTMEGCSCKEGNGGGVYVDVQESGIATVNGTARFEGCVSAGRAMLGGRGGGMMAYLDSEACKLMIGWQVRFSEENQNEAMFGKDVFVKCGTGILLETKISRDSFEFFDASTILLDPRRLCGTENGNEENIFPLFVYLYETESAVIVDGGRGKGTDHPHCGLLKFACKTIEYALMKRGDTPVIGVCNQSSLTDTALFERNRVRIEGLNENQAVINIAAVNESANGSLIKLDVDTEFCGIQFILPSRIKGYNAVFESYHKFLLENVTISSLSQAVSFTFATVKAGETMLENVTFHKTIFSGACGFATANSNAILSSVFKSGIEQLSSASNNCIFYIQGGTFKVSTFNCIDSKFQLISAFAFDKEFNAFQAENVFFANVSFNSSLIINRTYSIPSIKPHITISSFFFRNVSKVGHDSLLRMEFVNVSISDSMLCVNNDFAAYGIIVNVSNSTVKMSNCTMSGIGNLRSIVCNGENQNELQICCQFEGSLLYLSNCSSSIESTTFANSSAGALSVRDGKINLKNITFLNNTANSSLYNSVRRNILCENSSLSIASFSDESGNRNPDNLREGEYLELWMQNRGCTVSGLMNWSQMEDVETADTVLREFPQKAYLFCRPHISEITRSEKGDKMMIHFVGNNLLPCLVSYEVSILNSSSSSSEKEIISFPFITCEFMSQEEFVVEASKSQLKFTLNSLKGQIFVQAVLKLKEDEVYDSRRRMTQVVKTDPVLLQDVVTNSDEKVSQTKSTSNIFPWWIVFVAAAGFIVISVVIGQLFAKKRSSNQKAAVKL
ncbi:uncharacterized protein MONOS_2960 [Monocercomonoides exilis]|uniref:uncharacterized protein n=1 Tax=Monocercomonoides exilis TaxID=2049356 RepID=UPI00355A7622|nr:hypothetical protein MONOS_2960 [Monocercomonoides exilis]|eukprot:MONOS_2960.1-p1 / transcript=MONOS_2960.1 / gene=MONOS_2960 / organism=Monocercomonoides_exilis_PA203 / gene_product=unspecified product / transcript_product=unspecified product / location=Mono_scaffold00065:43482-47495(+) / protein_length=1338 / sequence_SO=supercontig / SO=protein_coding / is_pseudo=false